MAPRSLKVLSENPVRAAPDPRRTGGVSDGRGAYLHAAVTAWLRPSGDQWCPTACPWPSAFVPC